MNKRKAGKFTRKGKWLIGGLAALAVFHFVGHEQRDIVGAKTIPYNVYGLPFCKMPVKKHKRIILLGNSVWLLSDIVPDLLQLEQKAQADFEIGNFSMEGTSIADYLMVYNYVKEYQPDLIIVHLSPATFSDNLPLYRTEARKFIFTSRMKALWKKTILRTFSKTALLDSCLYSFFPQYRKLRIYRYALMNKINQGLSKTIGVPLMDFFPYPLDLLLEEGQSLDEEFMIRRQYEESVPLLIFFIDQLEQDSQPAIFIEQENGYPALPINQQIPDYIQGKRNMAYYNYKKFYQPSQYMDEIHPYPKAAEANAQRLFSLITRFIESNP